jgi:periplasmic protein TonB
MDPGTPVLRVTSSAVALCALGFSAVVHAAALVVTVGQFSHPGLAKVAAADDADVVVDLETDTALPEPATPVAAPPSRATIWPNHTHPYPVAPGHDLTPHDPDLVHVAAHVDAPAAAAPADTTTDDTPRFTIAIGPSGGADAHGAVSAAGTAAPHDDAVVIAEQVVDSQARLVRGLAPSYPAAARAEGVEGDVRLELVVGQTGGVESARVVRSVGHGLDEAALEAVRQFRFAAATKDGHAVRVRMGWSMQFRLQ